MDEPNKINSAVEYCLKYARSNGNEGGQRVFRILKGVTEDAYRFYMGDAFDYDEKKGIIENQAKSLRDEIYQNRNYYNSADLYKAYLERFFSPDQEGGPSKLFFLALKQNDDSLDAIKPKKKKRRIVPLQVTRDETRPEPPLSQPQIDVSDGDPQKMFMQDKMRRNQAERNKTLREKLNAMPKDSSDGGMNAADMVADETRRYETNYRDKVQRMAKLLQRGFPALDAKEIMERVLTKIKGPPAAIQQQQTGLDELRDERNKLINERNGLAQKIKIFKEADGAMDNFVDATAIQGDMRRLIASLEKKVKTLETSISGYKGGIKLKERQIQDVKSEMDEKTKLSNAIDTLLDNKKLLLDVINKIQDNKTRSVGDHILGEITVGIQGYTI